MDLELLLRMFQQKPKPLLSVIANSRKTLEEQISIGEIARAEISRPNFRESEEIREELQN